LKDFIFILLRSILSNVFQHLRVSILGADDISVKFFKLLLPLIFCHVLHVFKHAIISSVFPSMWKEAIIRPVAKVGTPSSPFHFHPISIVSQSNFHNCFGQIYRGFKVGKGLRGRCSSNHYGLFVHNHISSAHDMTLILQLWVSSFLRDRSMVVEVDGVKSTPRSLLSGDSQGCTLSLLCLSMIFVRVFVFQSFISVLMICRFICLGIESIFALNEDFAAISRWLAANGLLLNPRKVLPSLFLGTKEIPWCDAVTDLRVVIKGHFHLSSATKVCSRVHDTLHRLRLLKFLTLKRVRLKLCKALLLPYFFNCDVVFFASVLCRPADDCRWLSIKVKIDQN
jgi:hypothetical protein